MYFNLVNKQFERKKQIFNIYIMLHEHKYVKKRREEINLINFYCLKFQ